MAPDFPTTPFALEIGGPTINSDDLKPRIPRKQRQKPPKSGDGPRLTGEAAVTKFLETFKDDLIDESCLTPIKKLGEGAFATVILCKLTEPARPENVRLVAVKVIKEKVLDSEEDVFDFFRETQLLKRLEHPNIVKFIGVASGEPLGQTRKLSIVVEYMNYGTLKDVIARQLNSRNRLVYTKVHALSWMLDVARGLKYLHGLNTTVIHRDLKPENILLHEDEETGEIVAKLADFGLSAMVRKKKDNMHSISTTQTHSSGHNSNARVLRTPSGRMKRVGSNLFKMGSAGNVPDVLENLGEYETDRTHEENPETSSQFQRTLSQSEKRVGITWLHNLSGRTGSLMYMAPEVQKGKKYNESVDAFSFAMVMYEVMRSALLICFICREGTPEEIEMYAKTVAGGFRPPIPAMWPEELKGLIKECWSARPHMRPPMAHVVDSLDGLCSSASFLQDMAEKPVIQQSRAKCLCCSIQ